MRAKLTLAEIIGWALMGLMLFAAFRAEGARQVAMFGIIVVLYTGRDLVDRVGTCAHALERLADSSERANKQQAATSRAQATRDAMR